MREISYWRQGGRIAILGIAVALSAAGCGDDDNTSARATQGTVDSVTDPVAGAGTGRNGAPVISGEPATNVDPGQTYYFAPTVKDADGDALSFSIFNKPDWLSFDTATGSLTGSPTLDDAGHYPNVIIRVSDGHASSQLWPFSIDVLPNESSSAFLTWEPPTEYEDGSPLLELAGYRVRYGIESGSYSDVVDISNPFTTVLDLDFLSPDTYYFVITAYNYAGAESDFSNEETIALN